MNTKALQILFLKEHGVLNLQYLSENYSITITMWVTENKDQSSQKNLSTLAKIGTFQFIIHFFDPTIIQFHIGPSNFLTEYIKFFIR